FWPIECGRHDIAFGIYNSAGHCSLIARCPRRQSSEAGVEMKGEERGNFWLEQIKGRARPRINLEQLKCISIEDKIGAVQTNYRHHGIEPLHCGGHGLLHSVSKRRRSDGSAIAVRMSCRRRRPLCTKPEHQYAAGIA